MASNPTRAGRMVFAYLQGLKPGEYKTTMQIASATGLSSGQVHTAYRNIRTVLGPFHHEPLIWVYKGSYKFRLSDSAREVIDYSAIRLSSIITQLRVNADVNNAAYDKTGDAALLSAADGLRTAAMAVTAVRDRLLASR